jgi:hypothetical protein
MGGEQTAEESRRGRNPVAEVVGAWRAGNRASDAVIRERTRFVTSLAKAGVLGTIIAILFMQLAADRREFREERKLEREERAIREATLTGALMRLDGAISLLAVRADQEREACWDLRLHKKGSR